ncbi:hypothetical protein QUC31_016695 [Theobroma cacao]
MGASLYPSKNRFFTFNFSFGTKYINSKPYFRGCKWRQLPASPSALFKFLAWSFSSS